MQIARAAVTLLPCPAALAAAIWVSWEGELSTGWQVAGAALAVAVAVAHVLVLEARRRADETPMVAALVQAVGVAAAALTMLLVAALVEVWPDPGDEFPRLVGVLAAFDLVGTALVAVRTGAWRGAPAPRR